MFEHRVKASWGLMDFNGHLGNTAYLDLAADTRMLYFAANGFPPHEFARLRMGPVVRRDEVDYHREIHLLEDVRIDVSIAALAPDASRFRIRNRISRADGVLAARVTSAGGWLDLAARKLVVPPDALREAMASLPRDEDFEVLPSISAPAAR